MAGYRVERISELLKEVLAEILRDMKDPRIGLVSILDVKVSPDIRHAKVSVSTFGKEDSDKLIHALNGAKGFIRREVIARGVTLRHIPEFQFVYDDSIEYSTKISKLINQATEADRVLRQGKE